MDVIYFLIPLALMLLIAAILAFVWATKSGQFEDLDREAHRILFDEDMVKPRQQNQDFAQQAPNKEQHQEKKQKQ